MEWRDIVKEVRIKMQLTQSELSKMTGISMATIARWETTDSEPHPKQLGKFLEFCKKNNLDLINYDINRKEAK